MNQMKKTRPLIITETVRYEFEVTASMPENKAVLKRFFGKQSDPWTGADFTAVTERDFDIQLVVDGSKPEEPALHRR
jgi:hypothetical protein